MSSPQTPARVTLGGAARTALKRARVTTLTWAALLATTATAALVTGHPWRAAVALAVGLPVVATSLASVRSLVAVLARGSRRRTAASAAASAASVVGWAVTAVVAGLATVALHAADVVAGFGIVGTIAIVGLSAVMLAVHLSAERFIVGHPWASLGVSLLIVAVVLLPAMVARPTVLAVPAILGGLVVMVQVTVWVPIPLDTAVPDEIQGV